MSSKFELMLSDYTPQLNQEKQRLLKQRKTIYKTLIVVSLILLSLIISSIVVSVQYSQQTQTLISIDQDIETVKTQINYTHHNKRLLLNNTRIQYFALCSLPKLDKKIISVNLTNHCLNSLDSLYLPDLEQLLAYSQEYKYSNDSLLFRIYDCFFPSLKKIEVPSYFTLTSSYLGIEEFPDFQRLPELSANFFPNIKKIKFQDKMVSNLYQNAFPSIQEMVFDNSTSYNIHSNMAANLKILSINDTSNVLQSLNVINSTALEHFEVIGLNYVQLVLKNIPNIVQQLLDLPRLRKLHILNSSYCNFKRVYKQVVSIQIQEDYSFQTFDMSMYPKMTTLDIGLTSLKYFKKSSLDQDNLTLISIRNSSIQSFTNLHVYCLSISLTNNQNLTQFGNITGPRLFNLQISDSIVKIFNNTFPQLQFFGESQAFSQHSNLEVFENNYIPQVQKFSLANSKLQVISGNTFSNLQFLNLSNSNINDALILGLMINNKFEQPERLLTLDLRNNCVKNQKQVLGRVQKFFENAEILI